mmetsp:Transcript_14421/g.24601  ORF Transcript_14421/g.24601 Transcript_14421/m.24601 type:complete len:136 (+) Transcript_14421:1077-1484(+)
MANPVNPKATKLKHNFVGKPFQVFGYDILIDKDLKAWLLEINDHPSFDIYSCPMSFGCAHKTCPISQVDLYVKKMVMTDAIKLTLKSKKTKLTSSKFAESFRNMQRVFPRESVTELYETVKIFKDFFLNCTNGKL